MDKLMNVDEVAAVLGINRRSVERMVHMREIPSLKLGGSRRFRPKDIEKWVDKKVTA